MPSSSRPSPAAAFTEQQLRQLRAQCLVFLAFRDNMGPGQKHLEIALGEFTAEGSSGGGGGGDGPGAAGNDSHGETYEPSSSSLASSSSAAVTTAVLPPPDLPALSSLRLSSPRGGRPRRIIRRGPRRVDSDRRGS
ncbi:hypothetical protein BS78_05G278500 [Paspalum vaginatum]|nr:hypothetical protein BS78_05G278500 [Paspalum vaginatum]